MAYMRLTGAEGAFGWCDGRRITLGGLQPNAEYQLICDQGAFPAPADGRGAWSGQLLHDVLLCVAWGDRAVLWDENRVTAAQAAALLAARKAPPPPSPEAEAKTEPTPAPEAPPLPINPPEEAEPAIVYRSPSAGRPVDALPELQWPERAAQLRQAFANNQPCRLFDLPGWRTVRAQEAGMPCCFGFLAHEDRVCEALYGVRARGGLVPPKGLQGYGYLRALDGSGYWVLRQRV